MDPIPLHPEPESELPTTHEYIAALAVELADLAREAGDVRLAGLLALSASFAAEIGR